MVRFQRSHWIAFLALGCSSTTAWGQLPSNKISPINQINRGWGFGVSDGYHECPDPEKCRSSIDQKKSWINKVNPVGSVLYGQSSVVVPRYQAAANSPVSSMPMTTLPPAQQSYSQFAAPAETPLPGAHYAPQIPPPLPQPIVPQAIPSNLSNPQPNYPNFPRDNSYLPTPIPDPNASRPAESGKSTPTNPGSQPRSIPQSGPVEDPQRNPNLNLLNENEPTELVPPSPPLRRRQPTDKPLGEIPDSWSPPQKNEAKPQPQADPSNDEDLNLLPTNNGLPPVTYDYGHYGHPYVPVARNHIESYPQSYPQPNSPPQQPSYQQTYPTQQPNGQTYQKPSQPPVPGSRSLMSRENSNANNPYAALQVQQQPMYTTVQNPYAQYNSNRYR